MLAVTWALFSISTVILLVAMNRLNAGKNVTALQCWGLLSLGSGLILAGVSFILTYFTHHGSIFEALLGVAGIYFGVEELLDSRRAYMKMRS